LIRETGLTVYRNAIYDTALE